MGKRLQNLTELIGVVVVLQAASPQPRSPEQLQRMLYPSRARGATVAVRLPSGELVAGALAYRDEFTVALTDAEGRYRSWPAGRVTFTVDNPLEAHADQLGRYTDDDMHNVLAYLQTLR